MATPLVPTVQFDDRYNTRPIPTVTDGMVNDVVRGANTLIEIDAQKQVSDLRQESEDLAIAYKFAAKEQEVNRGQSAGVVDGANLVQAGPYQFDKSTLSSGQRAEYDRLTADLDRSASLVEQGRMTQTAFYARAEAMTKAAINRRPSLARELSSAAAERLGIDPMQGVRSIINEQNEWAKQKAEADKNSPQAKMQAKLAETALMLSGGEPPTETDWINAKVFLQDQQRLAMMQQNTSLVELMDKGVARASGELVKGSVMEVTAATNTAVSRLPLTPEGLTAMVESGGFAEATANLKAGLIARIESKVAELRAIGTPDANRVATAFYNDSMAELTTQLDLFEKIAKGGIADAVSINGLRERQRKQQDEARLRSLYGDELHQRMLIPAMATLFSTNAEVRKQLLEEAKDIAARGKAHVPSAGGAVEEVAPPTTSRGGSRGSAAVGGAEPPPKVPIHFESLDITKDVEKGKRLTNTLGALISRDPVELATVDITDKKLVGNELHSLFVNLGPGTNIGGRPVLGAAIQAAADALKTYRPAVPASVGEEPRKGTIQGQVSKALAYAGHPENIRMVVDGTPAEREVYKQMSALGFEAATAELSALNNKQTYAGGAKFTDLVKFTLVRSPTGSFVRVSVDEEKAKSAVVGYYPADKLALLRTQVSFFQGTVNQIHNSLAVTAGSKGNVPKNIGDKAAKLLRDSYGIKHITVGE